MDVGLLIVFPGQDVSHQNHVELTPVHVLCFDFLHRCRVLKQELFPEPGATQSWAYVCEPVIRETAVNTWTVDKRFGHVFSDYDVGFNDGEVFARLPDFSQDFPVRELVFRLDES